MSRTGALEQALARQRLSVRAAARKLAGTDDAKAVERERRNLNRWLGETEPSEDQAARLAAVFGGKPDDYRSTPSADPLSELPRSVSRELRALRRDLEAVAGIGARNADALAEVRLLLAEIAEAVTRPAADGHDQRAAG